MAKAEARALPAVLALVLLGALGFALWRMAAPATGPVDVPWDRVACARCRMLVSDPRFAAQLHEANGTVHFFDDPGCALLHRAEAGDAETRLYFHDAHGSGWLSDAEVAFERVPETPMAYGFAAVPRGSRDGTLTAAQVFALLEEATAEGLGAAAAEEPPP
ncbi:MAG: hypothetical protein ABFS41_14060 [Myxococcota bacterium]